MTDTVQPKGKKELMQIINATIKREGFNCNLNFIDTSCIEDMSYLFSDSKFNGDISGWNTSNVKDMSSMFFRSDFNSDISNWDVSNVLDMHTMFAGSKFNSDISRWNISRVKIHTVCFGPRYSIRIFRTGILQMLKI